MKGLPGWLFAAGSALPLRLRTAALLRATSLGQPRCAGLRESSGRRPRLDRGRRAYSPLRITPLAAGKTLERGPKPCQPWQLLSRLCQGTGIVWCYPRINTKA